MNTDMALVESAKSGDRKSFSELILRHQQSLLRLCLRFASSPDMAEDIVQDTFVKAFRKLDTFEGRSSFKSWLYQIAINTAKNKIRSTRDTISLDNVQISIGGDHFRKGVESQDLRELLKGLVSELPEKQKLALTLRIYDDLSFKEIAEIMECPYDTAKANYRHGLLSIKKTLEKRNLVEELQSEEADQGMEIRMVKLQGVEI